MKSNISQTEVASTKEPIFMSTKAQIINNNYYGSDPADNDLFEDTKYEVPNEAVMVSSPAYAPFPTESSVKVTQHGASQSYSTELPTRIYSTTASSSEETNNFDDSIQFSKVPYDHSDISFSPSDSEILLDGNNHISQYPMSTSVPVFTETRTEATEKNKFSKPIFKLKPTQSYPSSTEKYVLVHTISNDKQSEGGHESPTKKPTTNESIQSIIMMLNGSNPGPEYSVETMNVNNQNNYDGMSGSTPAYASTTMINREKYGSSSYYITTKVPGRPSNVNEADTNYVYSPSSTRRPPPKTTTQKIVNRLKVTPSQSPLTTPPNVPSTSYVYSPNPIRRRPTTAATPTVSSTTAANKVGTTNLIRKTTTRPSIIVKKPETTPDVQSNYVVISGGGVTKHPSPTVHITPKPVTNLLTSSTLSQLKQTKKPAKTSPTPVTATSTERPPFPSSTPATFISSSIYVPAIQDFHNEGYFVVTHQPANGVSSTAVYTINSGVLNSNVDGGSDVKRPAMENDPVDFNDVPSITNDDFSNFPPVRNPNLNMTATNMIMDESEISTPSFVEDEQLNSKIDLLVNKLVASMQGNLENLVDIVYERKNVTDQGISNLNKNGTLSDAKPAKTTVKPVNAKVTTKPPARVTTTGRPSQQTTKKTPTKASSTTKKPSTATKKPTAKPASTQTTRKPPARVTTTAATKKPTRKVTTTSTTERTPEDETIEEEGDENSETGEETEEEENIVEESEDNSTPAPLENGRIRKNFANFLHLLKHYFVIFINSDRMRRSTTR